MTETINDRINHSLNSLRKSKFRSKFKLTQKDRDYIEAKGKGFETIKDHACQFINVGIAPDFPKNDGKQTPMRGHAVFIAQHVTATCCRACILKWSGIEKGRALIRDEVQFIVALIVGWIERQLDKESDGPEAE